MRSFEIPNFVLRGCRPVIPDSIPFDVADIIKQCWDHNPRKRPCFQKIRLRIRDLQRKEIQTKITLSSQVEEDQM